MNSQQQLASPSETQQSRLIRWIVGVGAPLVAGVMFWWVPSLMGYADIMDDPTTGYLVLGITVALAFVGGVALRTWWALLIVPAAWIVGEGLTGLVMSLGAAGVNWWAFLPFSGGILLYVGVPLVIAAALGVLVGQWLARRSAAHKASQTPLGV